jgi:hypothetical protein
MAKKKAIKDNDIVRWTKKEKEALREVLLAISSAKSYQKPDECQFLWGSSAFNTDLARLAQAQLDGTLESTGIYEMILSPMYWKLRESFVEDSEDGDRYSFARVVWRAYNAGLMSSHRITPTTT